MGEAYSVPSFAHILEIMIFSKVFITNMYYFKIKL